MRGFLAGVLLYLGLLALPAQAGQALPVETVTIETAQGKTKFKAEIANTALQRAGGLMFRKTMAADHGMLFDFGEDRPLMMWMKNTPLSLDMIFAGADGIVVHIAENTVPYSEDIISSGKPVRAVFEVNAGTAKRLGLKPGDRLHNAMFAEGGG
ncbi:DUF192 domain-containing protein [soil metagenome]